jgi:hypothetical protein
VLEIERQIDKLPKDESGVLAAWFLERAEEEGLLNACTDAEEGGLAEDAEPDVVISKLRLRAGP